MAQRSHAVERVRSRNGRARTLEIVFMAGIDRPTMRLPDFDLFNRDRNAGSGDREPRFGETPRGEPQSLPSGVASDSPDAAAAPEGALVFPPTPPGARAPGELSAAERYEMLQNLERVAGRL